MFGLFKKKNNNDGRPPNPSKKMNNEEYRASSYLVDCFMAWNDGVMEAGTGYEERDRAKRECSENGIYIEISWGKSSKTAKEVWWSKNGERFFWGYE